MKNQISPPNAAACKEQTSENILKCTIDCFQEYGVEKTKITEIARRAGVASKTVYRHFKSKDALASAASAYFWGNMLYGISDASTTESNYAHLNGYESIMFILEKRYEAYRKNIAYFRVYSQTLECMHRNKTALSTGIVWFRTSVPYYHLLQKGIEDGSIRPDIDPAKASTLIWTMYLSIAQMLSSLSYIKDERYLQYEQNIFTEAQEMVSRYLNP